MTLHVCIGYVDDQRQCHNSILKFQCGGDESNLTGCSILDAANCSTGEYMCLVTQCTECQAQLGKNVLFYFDPCMIYTFYYNRFIGLWWSASA